MSIRLTVQEYFKTVSFCLNNIYIKVEKENKILYNIIKDCNFDFEK